MLKITTLLNFIIMSEYYILCKAVQKFRFIDIMVDLIYKIKEHKHSLDSLFINIQQLYSRFHNAQYSFVVNQVIALFKTVTINVTSY